ncbi:response regulator [Haloarcula marina]|uniref:response regulator n=1 Tax=Haloarcula marina TaxID=2961574 RepID=UPI0020B803D0|nr:response regulator [Halomicroarcula marina]
MGTVTGEGDTGTETDAGVGETRYTVLVVDDDRMVAALVTEFLEHVDDGLEVSYVTTPAAALDRLDASVDCVVTDYKMPGMDGVALVERAAADVGFVLYTATEAAEVAAAARERGGAYMQKRTDADQYADLAALVREQAAR